MEEIRALVLKEILGTITVAERERLAIVLEKDEAARQLRDQLISDSNHDEVREYFKQNKPADFASRVIKRVHVHESIKAWSRVALVTLIVGVMAGMVWLYHGEVMLPLAGRSVQLVLPGGERVDVERGDVYVGGVRFRNHQKQGRYEAVGLENQYAVLNVPPGKAYTITLSDGTVVQLNAASQLRFPLNFGDQSREVFIEGEAYVEVAKDVQRPFTVHLPGTNVQVLGTAFNVNTYSSQGATVALVEGAVRVVNGEDSRVLQPGEQAVAAGGIKVGTYDAYETLSWREGKYVLNNVRMEEVCTSISRLFGVQLQLDNVAVGEKRFSGVIDRNEPVEELLRGLKATNGVDYYWEDDVIHIK